MAAVPTSTRPCTIVHADLDAFFASVEQRDDPALAGLPVIVGGTGARGVVSTCSYQARLFGVRSAMPMAVARRLCPDAVVIEPRGEHYREVSAQVFAIFDDVADVVEAVSVDEAYLDITSVAAHDPGPQAATAVADQIRRRVNETTGLTVSVGVAPTKLAAKLASESAKPDGLRVVTAAEAAAFLEGHAVSAIPGIGPKTAAALEDLGLRHVAELALIDLATLVQAFGPRRGQHLADMARGRDDRQVEERGPRKQVGAERTFERDLRRPADLHEALADVCRRLDARVQAGSRAGRTVTVKIRYDDFSTVTRAYTLDEATADRQVIETAARRLLDAHALPRPVRLLGVSLSNLLGEDTQVGGQLRLFDLTTGGEPPTTSAPDTADGRTDRTEPADRRWTASTDPPVTVEHPDFGRGQLVARSGDRVQVLFDRFPAGPLDVGAATLRKA